MRYLPDRDSPKWILLLLGVIFGIRVLGVLFTVVTGANPHAQADAVSFARNAEQISQNLSLNIISTFEQVEIRNTNERVGLIWSPFWLIPGPSLILASLASAFFGSLGIYNVYVLGRYYHSHKAGLYAILPLTFYPSFVLIHSTILREGILLFALTMAARMAIVPSNRLGRPTQFTIAILLLIVASFIRTFVFPIVLITAFVVGSVFLLRAARPVQKLVGIVGVGLGGIASIPLIERVIGRSPLEAIEYLSSRRLSAARGRTMYLPDVAPTSIPEIIAFSWISVGYFLYGPFSWQLDQFADVVVWVESLGNIVFTIWGLLGVRKAISSHKISTLVLVLSLVIGVTVFSLGVANIGHAVRLRQMFIWIIFLFGGTGLAIIYDIRINKSKM